MIAVAKKHAPFLSDYARCESQAEEALWVRDLRKAAICRFENLGIPGRADEEWRYMNLKPLNENRYERLEAPGTADARVLAEHTLSKEFYRLVFVDGRCDRAAAFVDGLPEGVTLLSVAEALETGDEELKHALIQSPLYKDHAFAALNTALLQDGFILSLAKGVELSKPLQILFVSTDAAEKRAEYPRHFVHLGENAKAEIIECYSGPSQTLYLNNIVQEISLEAGASLKHCRIQEEGHQSTHLYLLTVDIAKDARYESNVISLGGGASRNEIEARLKGRGAYCSLNGMYLADGAQCMDNRTLIDHQQADGSSRQFYKGVLDGSSRGVFNGKVMVRPDAQRSDAEQNNRNLLLSEDAEADAKPQLEIYADDVKCSHGATVGQLDEDAVFYLRARGIGEHEARAMLTRAFAVDLLETLDNESLKTYLERRIGEKLRMKVE